MPRSISTWMILVLASVLPFPNCIAKQSSRPLAARQSQPGKGGRRDRAATATSTKNSWISDREARAKRPTAGYPSRSPSRYDSNDDFDDSDDSSGEGLGWSGSDDAETEVDSPWDEDDDFFEDTARRTSTDLYLNSDDYDDEELEGEDEEDEGHRRNTLPKSSSVPHGIRRRRRTSNDYFDDDFEKSSEDEWEHDNIRSPRGSKRGRDPRPSTWTGMTSSSGRRRRPTRDTWTTSRTGPGTIVRYQGRKSSRRGFSLQIPPVDTAALTRAFRKQMGTAREAMGQAGNLAASTTKKLQREVKLVISGSWESALLKVTWPDDLTPDENLVRSLVEAIKEFRRDTDVTKNSAEHRVLLRKLWAKMSETDWRTVTKAVYLFHCILRELPPEDHAVLKVFLAKMSRETDKRTGCRYFDLDVLCDVTEDGQDFRSFMDRYGTYVFKRAEGFDARFQELDRMRSSEGWEEVITALAKAQKAIDLGVSCQPSPEEETELTIACFRSTALDIRQLWRRFHSALAWVLEEARTGELFEGVDAGVVSECLGEFKTFYTGRYSEVMTFLADAEEVLGIYGLRVPDLSIPAEHDFTRDLEDERDGRDIDGMTLGTRVDEDEDEDEDEDDDEEYEDVTGNSGDKLGSDGDDGSDNQDYDEEDYDEDEDEDEDKDEDEDRDDGGEDDGDEDEDEDRDGEDEDDEDEEDDSDEDEGTRSRLTASQPRRTVHNGATTRTAKNATASTSKTSASARHTSLSSTASGVPSPVSASRLTDCISNSSSGNETLAEYRDNDEDPASPPASTATPSIQSPAAQHRTSTSGMPIGIETQAPASSDVWGEGHEEAAQARRVSGGDLGVNVGSDMGAWSGGKRQEDDKVVDLDEEEGGEEEGEVDDVDDLTYFDDATRESGTEGDWDRC